MWPSFAFPPDREEVFEAGDAFYVEPGHAPVFEAGTEMIQFSPTAEQRATRSIVGGHPPTKADLQVTASDRWLRPALRHFAL